LALLIPLNLPSSDNFIFVVDAPSLPNYLPLIIGYLPYFAYIAQVVAAVVFVQRAASAGKGIGITFGVVNAVGYASQIVFSVVFFVINKVVMALSIRIGEELYEHLANIASSYEYMAPFERITFGDKNSLSSGVLSYGFLYRC